MDIFHQSFLSNYLIYDYEIFSKGLVLQVVLQGLIWVLIASVPGLCIFFYFSLKVLQPLIATARGYVSLAHSLIYLNIASMLQTN